MITPAIQHLLDGDAVLFLGAGFSRGATNIRSGQLKSGKELGESLSALSGEPGDTGLEDAAEAYLDKFGTRAFIKLLQDEFTVKEVLPFHISIVSLPWRRIYSTNYDNIIEFACAKAGKRITPVTTSADLYSIPKDHLISVHFNGLVSCINVDNIRTEIKLTDSSYVTASVMDSQWSMLFREDLANARAVFFIGYSLFDLDIKRMIASDSQLKAKTFFYIGQAASPAEIKRLSHYGTPIPEDAETFTARVLSVAEDYVPRDKTQLHTVAISEYDYQGELSRITDNAFLDLLMWGKTTPSLIQTSLTSGEIYYLQRRELGNVVELVEGGANTITIYSGLGNGKSMLLEGIRLHLKKRGRRVFDLSSKADEVRSELQKIASEIENPVLIIENYPRWLDEISLFCMNSSPKAVIIMTARTSTHDVVIDDLQRRIGNREIIECPLDSLTHIELEWVDEAFLKYGQWASRAGDNRQNRYRYLSQDCNSQMHAILLNHLGSPDISTRLEKLTRRLQSNGANFEVLTSIFVLTLLQVKADMSTLTDIWGPLTINSPQFRRDELINELIRFDTNEFLTKSSIVAEYILRSFTNPSTLVRILLRIAECASKGAGVNKNYRRLLNELTRFSNIEHMLPEQGKRNAVVQYYESLKNLPNCRRNPLFWLHYAIACLVVEDLSRSQTYFETAYSLAEKLPGYNTYQLDNHYARLLILQALKDNDVGTAIKKYLMARDIIDRQMMEERVHYPFRVARNYQDFVNKFGAQMNKEELIEFSATAQRTLDRAKEQHRPSHRYMRECISCMEYVIKKCLQLTVALQ